jgi:hypothetical protein
MLMTLLFKLLCMSMALSTKRIYTLGPNLCKQHIKSRAEPETIDMGCPVQINIIFRLKENLFFTVRFLFFSEPSGCPDAYLGCTRI